MFGVQQHLDIFTSLLTLLWTNAQVKTWQSNFQTVSQRHSPTTITMQVLVYVSSIRIAHRATMLTTHISISFDKRNTRKKGDPSVHRLPSHGLIHYSLLTIDCLF